MSATSSAPGGQEKRFAAYLDRLTQAAEHADRVEPETGKCGLGWDQGAGQREQAQGDELCSENSSRDELIERDKLSFCTRQGQYGRSMV